MVATLSGRLIIFLEAPNVAAMLVRRGGVVLLDESNREAESVRTTRSRVLRGRRHVDQDPAGFGGTMRKGKKPEFSLMWTGLHCVNIFVSGGHQSPEAKKPVSVTTR